MTFALLGFFALPCDRLILPPPPPPPTHPHSVPWCPFCRRLIVSMCCGPVCPQECLFWVNAGLCEGYKLAVKIMHQHRRRPLTIGCAYLDGAFILRHPRLASAAAPT